MGYSRISNIRHIRRYEVGFEVGNVNIHIRPKPVSKNSDISKSEPEPNQNGFFPVWPDLDLNPSDLGLIAIPKHQYV